MHGCLSDLKIKENHCECWAKWSSGYKVTFICDSCFLQSSLTCFDGHPLVLGEARGGSGTYNCNKCRVNTLRNLDKKTCVTPLNQAHYTSQSSSWRCQEDFRRGGGNCNFDLCVNCVKNLGVGNWKGKVAWKLIWAFQVEHCAAWLVTRRLALMITVNRPSGMYPEETANPDPPPSEEDSENFKRLLKPIPAYLVRKVITKKGWINFNQYFSGWPDSLWQYRESASLCCNVEPDRLSPDSSWSWVSCQS